MGNSFIVVAGAAIAAALSFLGWNWLKKRKSGKKKAALAKASGRSSKKERVPNALVMDIDRGNFGPEYIDAKTILKLKIKRQLGPQWNYGAALSLYWLTRRTVTKRKKKTVHYTKVPYPETLKYPPGLLWEFIMQPETEGFFEIEQENQGLIKYGPYLAVFGISIFAMIVFTQGG